MPLGRSHPNGLSKFARRGDFPPRMSCISSPNGYEQSGFLLLFNGSRRKGGALCVLICAVACGGHAQAY